MCLCSQEHLKIGLIYCHSLLAGSWRGDTPERGAISEVPSKPPFGFHSELLLLALLSVNTEVIVMDPFKEVKDYFPILRGKNHISNINQK